MRPALATLYVLWFTVSSVFAHPPDFRWVTKAWGGDDDGGFGIALDQVGNICVSSSFNETSAVGDVTLLDGGVFIAKYTPTGELFWAVKAAERGAFMQDMGVDSSGNIFLGGVLFELTNDFGGIRLTNYFLEPNAFIAKYDPNGNCLWAKQVNAPSGSSVLGLAVDAAGTCFVTGFFDGGAQFETTNLVSSTSSRDLFVAKYDSSGSLIWVRSAGGPGQDFGIGIATDTNGNSYVTGSFTRSASFGAINLIGEEDSDRASTGFLAKYDSQGNVLWAQAIGGDGFWNSGQDVALDVAGNCFVTGNLTGRGGFGNTVTNTGNHNGMFVAKFDPAGNLYWARGAGDSYSIGHALAVDETGSCYATGFFAQTADFGGVILTSTGFDREEDVFVVKYDAIGNLLWAKQAGGARDDYGYGIAVDARGNCYATGFVKELAVFGAQTLMTDDVDANHTFLARIDAQQPSLKIVRTQNDLVVSWSLWASNFQLQSTTVLGPDATWLPVGGSRVVDADRVSLSVPLGAATMFFRLAAE